MTYEEFRIFVDETVPQALFHVSPDDIDDDTGLPLDELTLLTLLYHNKEVLQHAKLSWFVDNFLFESNNMPNNPNNEKAI